MHRLDAFNKFENGKTYVQLIHCCFLITCDTRAVTDKQFGIDEQKWHSKPNTYKCLVKTHTITCYGVTLRFVSVISPYFFSLYSIPIAHVTIICVIFIWLWQFEWDMCDFFVIYACDAKWYIYNEMNEIWTDFFVRAHDDLWRQLILKFLIQFKNRSDFIKNHANLCDIYDFTTCLIWKILKMIRYLPHNFCKLRKRLWLNLDQSELDTQ